MYCSFYYILFKSLCVQEFWVIKFLPETLSKPTFGTNVMKPSPSKSPQNPKEIHKIRSVCIFPGWQSIKSMIFLKGCMDPQSTQRPRLRPAVSAHMEWGSVPYIDVADRQQICRRRDRLKDPTHWERSIRGRGELPTCCWGHRMSLPSVQPESHREALELLTSPSWLPRGKVHLFNNFWSMTCAK